MKLPSVAVSISASRHSADDVTLTAAVDQIAGDGIFRSLGCNQYQISNEAARKLYRELKTIVDPANPRTVKTKVKK